jgi:hypothetical protein
MLESTMATVEDLLDSHLEAMGGVSTLRQTHAIESLATLKMGTLSGEMELKWRAPSFYYQRVQIATHLEESGHDGQTVWKKGVNGFERITGPDAMLRREGWSAQRFLDFRTSGLFKNLRVLGDDRVDDHKTWVVEGTFQSGNRLLSYLDKKSFLEIKRVSEFIHQGQRLNREVRSTDFRFVDGRRVAFELRQITPFNELLISFREHRINATGPKEWWEDVSAL